MAFTHLHVHSEFSLLDGLTRIGDLVAHARDRGFDSLALTDHGVMYGAIQFYDAAQKAGVKPIIGCELYVAPRSRHDRDNHKDSKPFHLTALAADATGYKNLVSLVSRAQLEGFYYKPRVDRELLETHGEGLVILSGCPSSELARQILDGQTQSARDTVAWYRDVFGERYFLEIQEHDIEFIPRLNAGLADLAQEFAIPLVATNDVHYALPDHHRAHEVLLCVQTGTTIRDPRRMRIGSTFYMRTESEMRSLFGAHPAAVDMAGEIAAMCNLTLDFAGYKLPVFPVPDGQTAGAYLRQLCEAGLAELYGSDNQPARERLNYELDVIGAMGFDHYFLIVWDLCRFAREEGIWWNVRGSGAGSIVSYCLRITNLDPLRHQLIFERFLNPSRISMPDIDLDFPDDQRDGLIRYTFDRYGHDRVAQIITFGTMGARGAIRDAGRALDMPLSDVDRVARLVPNIAGKPCRLDDALRAPTAEDANEFYSPDLATAVAQEDHIRELVETARSLEGVTRHASTHAAGVVIADRPLVELLPLHRPSNAAGDGQGLPLTQYAMNDVERLGLLKVDFLGLSTLTVLRRAAELVERYHGKHYQLDNIPLEDPAIYELLGSGDVTGVFQVEGAGMRRVLTEMRPNCFEHVVAAIALYRPGPMEYIPSYIRRMHGREPVVYRHPELAPILEETYGIIVYQEQIIQIARDLAGYDAGEADTIRKAVGKKIKSKLLEHREQFVTGASERGIDAETAGGIFDDIETFARYGFNKAHAADYAVIVCQTAFFKAHYPVEYMAALLSVERNDTDKVGFITADCHRMGIRLLRPSVNKSAVDFVVETLEAPEDGQRRRGIRFGLAAVKNVGEGAVRAILEGRGDERFETLEDFCRRADLRQVGRRALECLVKVGAFDLFGSRAGVLDKVDSLLLFSASHHDAEASGQLSLFGGGGPVEQPLLGPVSDRSDDSRESLAWEKELIGLYLSENPLQLLAESTASTVTAMIGELDSTWSGKKVVLAAMVSGVRRLTTKRGETMAFAQLSDLQGTLEATLFPRVFEATRELWEEDRLVLVRGQVELRDDRLQVVVEEASLYEPSLREDVDAGVTREDADPGQSATDSPRPRAATAAPAATDAGRGSYQLTITLPRSEDQARDLDLLRSVYGVLTTEYTGADHFTVRVPNGTGMVELEFPNSTTRYCVELTRRLEALLGSGRLDAVQT